MSGLVARTGRHRQLYENNFRLVAGCIPYKLTSDDEYESHDVENKIKVLMISSPNRDDLVFPKGGWENDETDKDAACREALEEAGVRGILTGKPLGDWEFRSKSKQEKCSLEGACRGRMFALKVTEELEAWPEQQSHNRIWLNIKDAYRLCRYEWMRRALEEFLRVMAGTRDEGVLEQSPNCIANPSSTQHLELLVRCSRPNSCIQLCPANMELNPIESQRYSMSSSPALLSSKRMNRSMVTHC